MKGGKTEMKVWKSVLVVAVSVEICVGGENTLVKEVMGKFATPRKQKNGFGLVHGETEGFRAAANKKGRPSSVPFSKKLTLLDWGKGGECSLPTCILRF